eukprot:6213031-Pleurochrysis_carterae.AAC.2
MAGGSAPCHQLEDPFTKTLMSGIPTQYGQGLKLKLSMHQPGVPGSELARGDDPSDVHGRTGLPARSRD